MSDIAEAWDDYRVLVLPPKASAGRVKDCRRAFYAGAETIMAMILRRGLGPTYRPPGYIARLRDELTQHKRDLADGRA